MDYYSLRFPGDDDAQRIFNAIMNSPDGGTEVAFNYMMSHFGDSDWRRLLAEAGIPEDESHRLINHFSGGGGSYPEFDHLGGRSPLAYYKWMMRRAQVQPQPQPEPEPPRPEPPKEMTLMERVAALEARMTALESERR